MTAQRFPVGDITITRVGYFDIGLPADAIGLTADEISTAVAAHPTARGWLDADDQPLVGQSFTVIDLGDTLIVVDPCGASDAFLRSGPEALHHQDAALTAFRAAGFDPAAVGIVLLSHLDGIGMAAWMTPDGDWVPAFDRAEIVVSQREYDLIAAEPDIPGAAVFGALDAAGAVRAVDLPHQLADGVRLSHCGGHSAGHLLTTIESGGDRAVLIGHLAVSPIDLLTPHGASPLHADPATAADALADVLTRAQRDQSLLLGPLWPSPGAVQVTTSEPVLIEPVAG